MNEEFVLALAIGEWRIEPIAQISAQPRPAEARGCRGGKT